MRRRSAWLSRGFEELAHRLAHEQRPPDFDFDVVIVGSGYGGAMAAAELAGCTTAEDRPRKISVCVLERGREYLPGMFPARMAELPGHVRFSTAASPKPRGGREGLFDMRLGADVSALLANGLGGGSLINAGVMEEPATEAFRDWPPHLEQALKGGGFYRRAREALGAADNTIADHARGGVTKHAALERLAGGAQFRDAAITVAMRDMRNSAGVAREECKLCGDCATGCNHEAKNSLDTNLLVKAWLRRAKIFTGATVLKLSREGDAAPWLLEVVHTDEKLRKRQGKPVQLRTRRVILAAGTYGSTEILLRSASDALQFSLQLGRRFSANGDSIAALYRGDDAVNAAADETVEPGARGVGPTITGIVDLRQEKGRCLVEDLAIPGPLRRAFEEVVTTTNALHDLAEADKAGHSPQGPAHDPCAVDAQRIGNCHVLALMSDDGAGGELELVEDGKAQGDGAIRVRWPELRDAEFFGLQREALDRLARNAGRSTRVLPNPLWQLLPDKMQFLLENERGPAFTVHPLGGCPLGRHADEGAVDEAGRVFVRAAAPQSTAVFPGLAVLDGSIVRSALGTNPALTIAALTLRAVESLRNEWNLRPAQEGKAWRLRRPVFAPPPAPQPPRATQVELMERVSGPVRLATQAGRPADCVVELTFAFKPTPLGALVLPQGGGDVAMARELEVRRGTLRVFDRVQWSQVRDAAGDEKDFAKIVQISVPVSGRLQLLHREASTQAERRCRALPAYLSNRGLRDTWQWIFGPRPKPAKSGNSMGMLRQAFERARGALALATRAGEARLLEYRLDVDWNHAEKFVHGRNQVDIRAYAAGAVISGRKRLTYARRSNPWRQLMRMELVEFPGLQQNDAVLQLDTSYLAREGVPLLRIVGQHDQPTALVDLASFAGYFVRLLLNVHIWSFRKPDAAPPRELQRLPGIVKGLPLPQICEFETERLASGLRARVRLTRYRPRRAERLPIVLVHGYSASGTTFAHPAVRPNLAEHLCGRNRDVWIVDLRTSSGMPTARHPWTFEDAAFADLPAAVARICAEARTEQVDMFAHCMGAAMFSMAVLAPPPPAGHPYFRELTDFPKRIHRVVLSQIGPRVVMSAENKFRGYVMSYLRHFLPRANYDFRVPENPGLMDQLLDRLLATLPYPEEEFDIENPPWPCKRTPFVGTRHRMDALYGRDFSLAGKDGAQRLDDKVLEHIDDLFGPLSLDTVAQAIQFARMSAITDSAGNVYYSREKVVQRWKFPTLSIHGEENGLADIATLAHMERYMLRDAGVQFEKKAFKGFGHQDSLIGQDAWAVFEAISEFLDRN